MTDKFPAKVTKSGGSKVITIPYLIGENYDIGDTLTVIIEKAEKR